MVSDDKSLPLVSVIVPSHRRRLLLGDLLDSLERQSYPPDHYEVIIVDGGVTDGTEELAAETLKRVAYTLRYYRQPNEGPAGKRNWGATAAAGEILGFIDSDCLATPNWIEEAVARFGCEGEGAQGGIEMVAGCIVPIDNLHHPVGFWRHDMPPVLVESALYPTANLFFRRTTFLALGGFDRSFGAYPWGTPMGGEDTDLAWRLRKAGYRHCFAPEVVVQHQNSARTPRLWLMDAFRPAVMAKLVKLHPQLRGEALFWGIFLDRAEAHFYLLLLGLVLAVVEMPLSLLFLLLALPWIVEMRGHYQGDLPQVRRWPVIPVKLFFLAVMFVIQVGALLFASVRYRALVL